MKTSCTDIMQTVFYPKSVAVIGAYSNEDVEKYRWTGWLKEMGYKGKVYPINPKAKEILGYKAYPSIIDVPDEIDYAIMAVSSSAVPACLRQVVEKGVKVVHLFVAGFAETGLPEGIKLQKEIEEILASGTTRALGPNCMGVFSTNSGMGFGGIINGLDATKEIGTISAISQSGSGMDSLFMPGVFIRGLRISKILSLGNSIDIGVEDAMEFFADDDETEHLFCYIEGIKDGPRFLTALKKCAAKKNVIILKGGITAGGARAAASHTGALASPEKVWDTIYKQARVLPVSSFEESVDQLTALVRMPNLKGNRVAIVGRGGGAGVATSDLCEKAGLVVAPISPDTKRKILELVPPDGSGLNNPIEVGISGRGKISANYFEVLQVVAEDPNIDLILIRINMEVATHVTNLNDAALQQYISIWKRAATELEVPVAVIFDRGEYWDSVQIAYRLRKACADAGIAAFPSVEIAARAISKAIAYFNSK